MEVKDKKKFLVQIQVQEPNIYTGVFYGADQDDIERQIKEGINAEESSYTILTVEEIPLDTTVAEDFGEEVSADILPFPAPKTLQ